MQQLDFYANQLLINLNIVNEADEEYNLLNNQYYNETGNYNIEVLHAALLNKGHDYKRIDNSLLENNRLPIGSYIINRDNYHYFAIKKYKSSGPIWNLDSLLQVPEKINNIKNYLSQFKKISAYKIITINEK